MGFKILKNRRREAGDTLIEVTIALSILSMVLIGSSVIATQAYRMGQTARERTAVVVAAQGQMEAVRSFRDNSTWNEFLNGGSEHDETDGGFGSVAVSYPGILLKGAISSTDCRVKSPCLHMKSAGMPTFLPQGGMMDGPVSTSFVEVVATPEAGLNPERVEVTVNYGFEAIGGGTNVGHITTIFTSMQTAPPTPPPVQLPCDARPTEIALVMDTSSSMKEEWDDGQTREEQAVQIAKLFVDKVNISPDGNHMGLAGFNGGAKVYTRLTSDTSRLKNLIDNLEYDGDTNYGAGIKAANIILGDARSGTNLVMVFISDGIWTFDPEPHMATLPPDTVVYTIGLNPNGLDMDKLHSMVRNGGYFTDAKSPNALQKAYDNIASSLTCK